MGEFPGIWTALRERYPSPEYAYFEEVRNSTGFARTVRTADALVMGLWPSRGLELHGIEVKVSRSDWLREKKTPEKAEEICRFCDRWWLAVSDAEIVKDDELPKTWGLLVPRGKRLVAAVEAPKLEAEPLTRQFLAGLLRTAAESNVPRAEFQKAINDNTEAARKDWEERSGRETQRLKGELDELRRQVAEFERTSGLRLRSGWGEDGAKLGAAVRLVLDGGVAQQKRQLEYLASQANNIADEIRRAVAATGDSDSSGEAIHGR